MVQYYAAVGVAPSWELDSVVLLKLWKSQFGRLEMSLYSFCGMKTLGIIGGIGPESTMDYYRLLIAAYRERVPDKSAPAIIINSIDMHKMLDFIACGEVEKMAAYVVAEVRKLAGAGADFALIAANTPHIAFDQISSRSSIPLISIVEVTCTKAKELQLKKLGLFGTRFTMQGSFYRQVFSREEISLFAPGQEEQAYIHDKYMNELGNGIFLPETRQRLVDIAERIRQQQGIEGLILAGTELPLIFRDVKDLSMPVLDTTRIHVDAAIARMLA